MSQKSVLTIQDISCVGRCSLTVALPIISAGGIICNVLPTAVLSTHTGGFEGYTFNDLTGDFQKIADHWKSLGLRFDAIYTGYLGSEEQIELVAKLFEDFRDEQTVVVVDPAMADLGVMYSGFTKEFALKMAGLASKANIILPNITEACMMLNKPYREFGYGEDYIEDLLTGLYDLGHGKVLLSGVSYEEGSLGVACYDGGEIKTYFHELIEGHFHGSGDVFASSFVTAYIKNGGDLLSAASLAADFTVDAIRRTKDAGTEPRYGIAFEEALPLLIGRVY